MIWFYSIGIIVAIVFLLITRSYRKKDVKNLDRKKHRLKLLYPTSLWLVDRLPNKLVGGNAKINRELKELSVKENIKIEKDFYMAKKMSIVLLVIMVGLIAGLGTCMSNTKALQ